MNDQISFGQHKKNLNIAKSGMTKTLAPLNEKLAPLDMMIYLCNGQTMLNTFEASSRAGLSIYIDDNEIETMMSMTDDQLIKKLRRQ
ncbi:hypothetical protein [Psychrobacter sp. 72-O-c]|uniref:hypothetical protein n=1 Tax=Psychrobacter sp. 72-O-c TaxID=2774125 RepID=UPI0019189010|nr:hypothetical protein [Psychrobacter sp. 72-O-c]